MGWLGGLAQPAGPCPATGISTDPTQPINSVRPDRRNTFFNWWNPATPPPYDNRVYQLYSVSPRTGQGRTYFEYTPYQQPDNLGTVFLSGSADLPANGWELLAYNLGYTEQGQPRPAGAPLPYVVLYHRFTGLLRVFATVAEQQQAYTYHYLTLRFAAGQGLTTKSGLLNRVAAPATALLDAPAGLGAVLTGVGRHLNQAGKWFVADFPLEYDPCTCLFRSELEIDVMAMNPTTLNLPRVTATGPIAGLLLSPYGAENVQDSGTMRGFPMLGYQGQTPGSLLTTGYYNVAAASQQRQALNWLQATTHDPALVMSLDSAAWFWLRASSADQRTGSRNFLSPAFLQDPRTERFLNGLDYLTVGGLSTNLPGTGVVPAQQPNAYAQTGSRVKGFSQPTDTLGIIRLATPGAVTAPTVSRYPYYNEVLGVLSLLRRPTVQRQVTNVRDADGHSRLRYRFRLPADLAYALNPAAGLVVTDFRAALVVAGSSYPATLPPGDFATYEAPLPLSDDPAGPVQHLVRTAYVPAGCLPDQVFTLDGPTDCDGFLPAGPVSVKVWVQLRRPDAPDAQPVLLVARYPATVEDTNDPLPAAPSLPTACTRLLPPQPAAAITTLCASPAYREAMRADRAVVAEAAATIAVLAPAVLAYPNPTTGPLTVQLALPTARCVRLRLFDAVGRLVAAPLPPTPFPSGITQLPLSGLSQLAAGTYFLVLDADNQRLGTARLIVTP